MDINNILAFGQYYEQFDSGGSFEESTIAGTFDTSKVDHSLLVVSPREMNLAMPATNSFWCSFDVYYGAGVNNLEHMKFQRGTNDTIFDFFRSGTNAITIRTAPGFVQRAVTPVIADDTLVRITCEITFDSLNGSIRMFFDDNPVPVVDYTGPFGSAADTCTNIQFRAGDVSGTTGIVYYSQILVASESTFKHRLMAIDVVAQGNGTGWNGTSSNFDGSSGEPAVNDAFYASDNRTNTDNISSNVVGQKESATLAAKALTGTESISGLLVPIVAESDAGTAVADIRTYMRSGGTDFNVATTHGITPGTALGVTTALLPVDLSDSGDWTVAKIAATELGLVTE